MRREVSQADFGSGRRRCTPGSGLSRLRTRVRRTGVAVELELVRGVTHDFIKMGRALTEARAAQQHIADALRAAFAA